ncbi:NupC/NupG family nucleoside CNT transporter [Limnoraphis robusta]|uniref:Nucleoside transporter C-terminal domain-containing protein n=1 Tax=Limnoraphis robusta CCNP1315 TaxID=3110306 RepID=A0ABU5TXY1_9CYAN|nr:nucleoside transporter C-terminal domain-containing protein [Limnoraphis robusta]MEA5519501.1 nucleoside transporter C-terminal domain-containing protein [Limnoraphis robusta CCNP1315]MEA5547427.1 nucleoside transporter C-terminal domain-containing protein [Limnoraphis robusta CCNP1324]
MNPLLNLISLLGIAGLCTIAWLGSENRRVISWNVIIWGIGLQLLVGLVVFVFGPQLVEGLSTLLNAILDASEAGARFLFGGSSSVLVSDPNFAAGPGPAGRWIARAIGTPYVAVPGDRIGPDSLNPGFTYVLAFRALPQVIFFAGLVSLLYRLNIIQPVVQVFAKIFQKTMGISGAESLAGAANIFVGIESAIAVKPFLLDMTRSELCAILTSCFGSIASSVLALYAGFLRPTFPTITGHLVSASILTIPACFVVSKLLVPETGKPKTMGGVPKDPEEASEKRPNPMDSLIGGALDGVKMAVGIAAALIAILGMVALINLVFSSLADLSKSEWIILQPIGSVFQVITLQNILGALFLPLTFITGISLDWQELWQSSVLIGRRLLETNIPPYQALAQLNASGGLSNRAMLIVSYVLCGFTHFASYGIFVGGLSSLIPSRSSEVSSLGLKALWAGTLATLMTGCIAGVFDFGNPAVFGK